MMAVNGENVIKCLRPGFEPVTYCNGFFGSFRLVDMTTGPNSSLVVVTEAVARPNSSDDDGPLGYMYIISAFGLPTACVALPGVPQSITFVGSRLILAIADTKTVYEMSVSAFL